MHHSCKHVKPLKTVGLSKLKDGIDSKDLKEFGQDLKNYHTWLEDSKTQINQEEGQGNYKKYLICVFRTYKTSMDKEFRNEIKEEKQKWVIGHLSEKYTYNILMQNGLLLFNNKVANNSQEFNQAVTKTDIVATKKQR